MRILVNACNANMGGALTYLTNLVEVLPSVSTEHKVWVLAPHSTLRALEPSSNQEMFHWIPTSQTQHHPSSLLKINFHQVPHLIKTQQIDVLFSSTGFGSLRVPCPELLLIRNTLFYCALYRQKQLEKAPPSWSFRFKRWMGQLSILCADRVLFPSHAMKDLALQGLPKTYPPTHVLHYGFSKERFFQQGIEPHPIVEKIKDWKNEGYHILLHVSSYAIHKNIETLVEALAHPLVRHHKIKLITTLNREKTGEKQGYDQLWQRIKALQLTDRIETTQHLPYNQVRSVYEAADIFVFPSFSESFGHPLVEAMSSGLPVIAADRPIHRELCQEAGMYFDVFSPEDCARKIDVLLRDQVLAEKMRGYARQRARLFSWKHHFQQWLILLKSLVSSA